MKKMMILTVTAAVALWGQALVAQGNNPTPNANPAGDQTKIQKRDGTGANHAQNQAAQGQQQKGKKNNKQAKAKTGPADGTGNQNRSKNGAGAQSGNRTGPLDGTGNRQGGWNTNKQGTSGSWGTGQQGTMGRGSSTGSTTAGGRGGRGGRREEIWSAPSRNERGALPHSERRLVWSTSEQIG